ncbi:DUF2189 domain-containing protein [Granulosicoccus antarcticus]|uniref:DUF2189 domain-containing protein n=1 Tax=Granulosicoccus antarcticus IMCC3135 TaxID=1192854 RepID=A0A2Z2NX56_9GAMM|nr:DUF2189 domain-containing protein [Granulosicoccus antarcticus]ASJ76026.1 hypothetical protein IMCC3135_29885 [Granulosicoccus antarcticus IMCC3135]
MTNTTDNSTGSRPSAGSPEAGGTAPVEASSTVGEELPPPMPAIRRLEARAPLSWLQRGWQDMVATRFKGCLYGLVFVLMGYAIVWVYATKWQLTMGLIGGFFLMGPFLCTGIYDLSRQQEKFGKASLTKSLTCWSRNLSGLAFFAIILTFAMIVWARVSLILFALSSTTSFPTVQGVLSMIFSFQNPQFLVLWVGVGFIFASIVFALSVISAPMMLDRTSDTFMALFSSVRSLQANPRPLYFWALLVVVIIGLSLAAGFLPLLITAPLIGHATWHAYRDLVEPESAN